MLLKAYGDESSLYKFYKDRKICDEDKSARKTYDQFYKIIKFNCYWSKFVDAFMDPTKSDLVDRSNATRGNEIELYDIDFGQSDARIDDVKYKTVSRNLFENIKIRSLSLRNLNIEKIDDNAFDHENFGKYLEKLDLSNNKLKRIDAHALGKLTRLEQLNLAGNKLTFGDRNFEKNTLLRTINLSNNDIQFLSPKVFAGLHRVDRIDLSRNHIKNIDACVFSGVQSSPISSKYSPIEIDLQENPVDCDCTVFYLNRHLNYKLNLTCSRPDYYNGQTFAQLKRENPEGRCNYKQMYEHCNPHETLSERELSLIIALSVSGGLLLLVTCCCCCNSISQTGKINKLSRSLDYLRQNYKKNSKKQYYVQVDAAPGAEHKDGEKLIQN